MARRFNSSRKQKSAPAAETRERRLVARFLALGWKGKLLWSLVALVAVQAALSLGKLICYETIGSAGKIRHAVGKRVRLVQYGVTTVGTLREAGYRWNDKFGFFDLAISIRWSTPESSGGWSSGLSPREAGGVEFLGD